MEYLLAHDLGTSGNKATLFSENGELVSSCVYSYNVNFFNGNWAEQNPEDFWRAVCSTSVEMAKLVGPENIAAVSFSGQMMGCICVDDKGEALRPSIIWADQRAVKENKTISNLIDKDEFYSITGHRNSEAYSIQKFMWIKNNEPEVYGKTYKMLNAKDYVIHKLTGEFLSDFTDASGTNAYAITENKWSEKVLDAAGIPLSKMPELFDSTHIAGKVSYEAARECGLLAGTRVVLGGGDGSCAAAGAGATVDGKVYCCLGSSAWVMLASKAPVIDKERMVVNWASMRKGIVHPCGTMQTAGLSYSWMRDNICKFEKEHANENESVYSLINNQIEESVVGSNGLLYLPYLMGERSPRWNPYAKGCFIGLKAEHTRKDLLRSVVEGVTMNLCVILDVFRKYGVTNIDEMLLIGGGAKSPVWMKIMADCFGVDILRPNYIEEATSMGAALAAGVGVGIFKDFSEISKFLKVEERIKPDLENTEKYKKIMPVFNDAYYALCNVFDKLS